MVNIIWPKYITYSKGYVRAKFVEVTVITAKFS